MPIISHIGARSWKIRAIYAVIFVVLVLGSVSMIYPLLLMLAGSTRSEADAHRVTPYPEFWFSDLILFQKYAESKYDGSTDLCQFSWGRIVSHWRMIRAPAPVSREAMEDFRAWRASLPVARRGLMGHRACSTKELPKHARGYRQAVFESYHGDLAAFCRESGQVVGNWNALYPPQEDTLRYRNLDISPVENRILDGYRARLPPADFITANPEAVFVTRSLVSRYSSNIAEYNRQHGSAYAGYEDIRLSERPPGSGLERADWEDFVRNEIALDQILLRPEFAADYRRFLARQYPGIEPYNAIHGTNHRAFDEVRFVSRLDDDPLSVADWDAFLKDREACPLEAVEVRGAGRQFAQFVRARRGAAAAEALPPFGKLIAAVDWQDCMAQKAALRWEFTTRNYKQVLSYLALHGRGLLNTLIYCVMAIVTALVVNPLAAYALSRFRLPGTYKILLFCMATMAFPGEVTMIPAFALIKRFPLVPLSSGIVTVVVSFLVLEKLLPRWRENWRAGTALALGLAVGAVVVPVLFPLHRTESLLNTFSALILPGMASGYSIFLLKGFFDSLPRELYEAADLDGAGEWCKFWNLTIRLSSPILAVIALGAFTSAYSAFMMALINIPDQKMWTIMVWIFQLQTQATQATVYASLVIAALPTFLIFLVCQNVIMRGIVVPAEK